MKVQMNLKQASSVTAIILALCVVFPTAISPLLDRPIKKHQEQLLALEIRRSNCIQLGAYHQGRINAFEILEALSSLAPRLGLEPAAVADSISKGDPEGKQLFARYESGEMEATQYLQEMGNLDRRKKQHFSDCVEQVGNEITELHSNPPRALAVKQWFPIAQIIGVMLVILVNGANLRRTNA